MTISNDVKSKWERVVQRLRAELGEDLYSSWFARMEIEDLSEQRLTVSVPTRFLKSWIETHYISKLQKIGEAELGALDAVQVRVRTRGLPAPRVAPEAHETRVATPQQAPMPVAAPSAAVAQAMNADRMASLDPSQNFDSFIVGPSNQLAHAAMCRVADAAQGAAISFNPLFVHAGAGLGKTHLLSAVAHRIRERRPDRKVMFLTAERFMINFVMALRQKDTISFKDQFAAVDVLLIDDFQFLQGKTMQQEFCHAFNSLVDQRRQVIVAADVPPAQLDAIDQRMRSRLMGGLVVDIESPDIALRRKILSVRRDILVARDPGAMVNDDILELVAERVTGGGRELEGALNRIAAFQQFNSQPITLDLASMVLRDAAAQGQDAGRIKIDDILKVVGRHYNVSKNDLLSPRRARNVVVPRQIGMYLAKKLTSRSLPEIGRRFGGRDHSTVLHAVRKIDDLMRADEKLAKDLAQLIRLIEQGA